jgi:YD repeat-containing protein
MRNLLNRFQYIFLLLGLLNGIVVSGSAQAQTEDIIVGKARHLVQMSNASPSTFEGACNAALQSSKQEATNMCTGMYGCVTVVDVVASCQPGIAHFTFGLKFQTPDWNGGVNTQVLQGNILTKGIQAVCPEGNLDYATMNCVIKKYNFDSCTTKNPVAPASGEKLFFETDYQGAGAHPLDFQRYYRSNYKGLPSIANGWIHSWQRAIEVVSAPSANGSTAAVQYADGKHAAFKYNGTAWTVMTNGRFDTLTEVKTNNIRTGWQLKIWSDDSVEHYSANGALLKIVQRNGWTSTVTYSIATTSTNIAPYAGLPITITNHFGRKLELRYNLMGQLITLFDPAGGQIKYTYDTSFNLTKVTWQDNTAKQYLYAQPTNGRLTGVIDEMGVRVGTFTYDSQGRVLSSEKAGGAEKLTFLYNADKSTSITDYTPSPTGVGAPTATTRVHKFGYAQGVVRPTSVTAPCPVCGNTAASSTYDASGNVTQRTEHDGTVTKLTYDNKNRELTRVIKYGSPSAKTYTSQWHAYWNLPTKLSEALNISSFVYDTNANLTSLTYTPTTDGNGSLGVLATRDLAKPIRTQKIQYDLYHRNSTASHEAEMKNMYGFWINNLISKTSFNYAANGDFISTNIDYIGPIIVEVIDFKNTQAISLNDRFKIKINNINLAALQKDFDSNFVSSNMSEVLYAQMPPPPAVFPTAVMLPTLPSLAKPPGAVWPGGFSFPDRPDLSCYVEVPPHTPPPPPKSDCESQIKACMAIAQSNPSFFSKAIFVGMCMVQYTVCKKVGQ